MLYNSHTFSILLMNEHLNLLRAEYLRLQKDYADLKRDYDILVAASQDSNETAVNPSVSFVQKLMTMVSQLFDKDLYRLAVKPSTYLVIMVYFSI